MTLSQFIVSLSLALLCTSATRAEYPIDAFQDTCGPERLLATDDPKVMRCAPLINGVADAIQYLMAEQRLNPLACLPVGYPQNHHLLLQRLAGPLQEIADETPSRGAINAIIVTLINQFWCEGNQAPRPPRYGHTAIEILPQCVSESESDRIRCGVYAVGVHNTLEGLSGTQGTRSFYCPAGKYSSMKSVLAMTLDYLSEHPEQQHEPLPMAMSLAMMDRSPCTE